MKLSDRRMHWPVGAFISFLGHFAHLSSVSRLVVDIGAKRKSALSAKRELMRVAKTSYEKH